MNESPTVSDLLLEWEEANERGEPIAPEQLCRSCPELLPKLRAQISALHALENVLDLSDFRESSLPSDLTRDGLRDHAETWHPVADPAVPRDNATQTSPGEPWSHSPRPAFTTLRLPGYEILDMLGRGGMGVVYLAKQLALDRLAAIKMILTGSHASPGQIKRFDTEARMIAQLRHPNIIQIYELGSHDGFPFFVLEYADSGSLESVLKRGSVDPFDAAKVIETVARAVHHAHRQGIIHRDLKPANILLQRELSNTVDPSGKSHIPAPASIVELGMLTPKITDFGLARHLKSADERLTQTGFAVGTPAYMSPEQARRDDDAVGVGSDIFSLGVILYQCLTGRRPFEAKTDWELMGAIVRNDPVSPRKIRPEIAPDLQAICLRCLRKRPGDRYATANALAEDLRRYIDGEMTHARIQARRKFLLTTLGTVATVGFAGYFMWPRTTFAKLGVLVPFTGPMAQAGSSILDAAKLGVAYWNQENPLSIQRHPIEIIYADGGTTTEQIIRKAHELIEKERVAAIIGGASSMERLALQQVVNQHRHLLFAPSEFEGLDESDYVFNLGGIPNQLQLPAIDWWRKEKKLKKVMMIAVGSIYPGISSKWIEAHLAKTDTEYVGWRTVPLGSMDFSAPLEEAEKQGVDGIIAIIRGSEAAFLVSGLARMKPVPVLWFGISEELLRPLAKQMQNHHYFGSTYFEQIDSPINDAFIKKYRAKRSSYSVISEAMDGAFTAVNLWARAAVMAKSVEPAAVRRAVRQQEFHGPGGMVKFSERYNYISRYSRVGQFDANDRIKQVWVSAEIIEPEPFPADANVREEWEEYRRQLAKQ